MAYKSKFMKAMGKGDYDVAPMREPTDQTFPEVSTGEYKSDFMRQRYAQQEQEAIRRTYPRQTVVTGADSPTVSRYRATKGSPTTLIDKATSSPTVSRYRAQKGSTAQYVEGSEIPAKLKQLKELKRQREDEEKPRIGGASEQYTQLYEEMKRRYGDRVDEWMDAQERGSFTPGGGFGANEENHAAERPWYQTAYDAIGRGAGQFNSGITSTLDFAANAIPRVEGAIFGVEPEGTLTGQLLKPLTDATGYVNDFVKNTTAALDEQVREDTKDSRAAQIATDLTSGVVSALPNSVLAFLSGGASAGGQLAAQGTGLSGTVSNAANQLLHNPMFQLSAAQTLGSSYDEAKEAGASDIEAMTAATVSALLNALVEVGGGIETLPGELQNVDLSTREKVLEWVKSALDEGKEEVIQGVISNLTNKATFDSDRPYFSTEDDNAVVNPLRMAQEFGSGAAIGGILSGGQMAANSFANRAARAADSRPADTSATLTGEEAVARAVSGIVRNNNQLNIDNTEAGAYTESRSTGGANNGTELDGNSGTGVRGRPDGGTADRGVPGRSENVGREDLQFSGVVLLSPESQQTLTERGIVNVELHDSSADNTAFSSALDAARAVDSQNGWAVTPKSPEELAQSGAKSYMDQNGSTGFAIAPDGDIEAVFANKAAGAPKGATKSTIPQAIALGGDKLDCYGEGLVKLYSKYGFEPVARVRFNPEYANPGWTADKGSPDIYFMMHNGDSADAVVQKMSNYKVWSKAELDALPVMEYDEAYEYRDALLNRRKGKPITVDDVMPKVDNGRNEAMGAADYGFSPYSNYQNTQSEFLPEGANAARPVDIPATDPTGQRTTRFAANAAGAQVVPDSLVPQIESDFMDGKYGYEIKGDQQAVDNAKQFLEESGYEQAKGRTIERLQSLKNLKQTVVDAQMLIQQAVQDGRDADAAEMLLMLGEASPEIAQGLQAFSIFRKLTPEGQLEGLKRTVQHLEEKVNRRLPKKARNEFEGITIDEDLKQKFLAATDDAGREAVLEEIYQDIGKKIPTTFKDIANQWRYTSMLLNPSTHARNIVGNTGQLGLSTTKDAIATLGEMGVDWASKKLRNGKGIERTKAFLNLGSESDAQLVKLAGQDYDTTARDIIMGGGKYNDSAEGKINQYREIWKLNNPQNKVEKAVDATLRGVGKVSDVNSSLMDLEDTWFSKPMYQVALAGYMKANGLTEITDEARAYAVKEAQKSTYRDSNIISDWAKRMGRDEKGLGKAVSWVVNTIFPFKGTPANVGVRAWEYSPAGFLTTMGKAAVSAYNGTFDAASFIDDLSANLVGSAAAGVGILLAQSGILKVSADDQDENEGYEDNSINLFGYSVPINNLGSVAIPVLVGGAIYENFIRQNPDEDGHPIEDFLEALSATLDPVLESSMLTGLQDLVDSFESGDYGDASLGEMVQAGMISVVGNYIASYIPTILSKVANATDTAARKTYVDKNKDFADGQRMVQSWQKKVPFLRQQLTEMVDQYGDTVEGGLPEEGSTLSRVVRAVAGAVSPTYWSKIKTTEVDKERRRIYQETGQNVFVSDVPKRITVDGKNVNLTGEQWTQYGKTRNSMIQTLQGNVMESEDYDALSYDVKGKAFDLAEQYANELGKAAAGVDYKIDTEWMNALAGATPEEVTSAIINRAVESEAKRIGADKYDGLVDMLESGQIEDKVAIACLPESKFELWTKYGEQYKVPVSTLMDVISYGNSEESKGEKNAHGKDIKGKAHQDKMREYLNGIKGLSTAQKRGIWKIAVSDKGECPW